MSFRSLIEEGPSPAGAGTSPEDVVALYSPSRKKYWIDDSEWGPLSSKTYRRKWSAASLSIISGMGQPSGCYWVAVGGEENG